MVGPLLWVVALSTVAWVLHVSYAIELGLLIASIAALVSTIVLVSCVRLASVRSTGMRLAAEVLLSFVALYPLTTAALWISGGLLFRWLDEELPRPSPDTTGQA